MLVFCPRVSMSVCLSVCLHLCFITQEYFRLDLELVTPSMCVCVCVSVCVSVSVCPSHPWVVSVYVLFESHCYLTYVQCSIVLSLFVESSGTLPCIYICIDIYGYGGLSIVMDKGFLECICADCVITGCLAWVYHVILDEMKDIAVWIFLFCFDVVAAPL